MQSDAAALIVATVIGIFTTYLVFCLEDILLGELFSNTVNIAVALFIGGTVQLLTRHFLINRLKARKRP